MTLSRRSALRWVGVAAGLSATAGCLSFDSGSDYTLVARANDAPFLGARYLVSDPVSVGATTRVDFDTETKEQYVADLFENGQVTVVEWPLVRREDWGTETRPRPTFVLREGTYYEVQVTAERRLERERWLFAFERRDEVPPDDARVATDPFTSLSEKDRRVVDAALGAIYAGSDDFLGEPEFEELQAVEFHQDLPAGESDLVPSPPFDYVDYENDYFRPVTDQRVVSVPEWTYEIEPIAESKEEFVSYASDTIPTTRLSPEDVSESAREVLETAIEEDRHQEDAPLSDGLSAVLDELGIAGDLRPLAEYDDRAAFREVVASYDDVWYVFDLLVDA